MDKNQLKHIIKEEYQNVKSFMEDKYGFTPELGKVISNPYAKSFVNEVSEPEVISQLRDIVNKKQNKKIKDPKSGKMMRVDLMSASAVIAVYDALRKPNVKANFASQPLPKMVNVAFKVAKVRKENVAKNHDGKAAPYGSGYKKVNELLVIVDKFDKNKQDYGKIYYRDGGNRPGDGDIKKANKELEKLSKKHKGLTLVSIGRNSKMYDVNNPRESVNEGYGPFIKAKNLTDIIKLSKQKKNATFYVTDDNNSRIGSFYLKNGKFAKATTANPNYDLQRNKTKLKDRSDVIYKYKVDESVNEADITVGGKEYNLKKSGSKITLINKKLSADKFIFRNTKEFKDWADDQVEPIGGTQSSHFGINEAKYKHTYKSITDQQKDLKRIFPSGHPRVSVKAYHDMNPQGKMKTSYVEIEGPSSYVDAYKKMAFNGKGTMSDVIKFVEKNESLNEAFLVAYGKREGNKSIKPAFAAYADKKMAQKFMADMKKDGYKVMMTQKKIKGIDESVNEGVFSNLDLIRQNSKDARDFIKNVFKDDDFKDMKNDREFLKYLKSIYEGFASDAQRRAAFASGYKAKGKKGKKKESIEEYDVENYQDVKEFIEFMKEYEKDIYALNPTINEAEYQGRDVKLGKIMQGDVKKFKVYVKNPKGNVVKVNFGHKGKGGEKTMRIKKSDPARRKAFRSRHNCDNPGPRHKARYWACRTW